MTKAVRELNVVFDDTELSEIELAQKIDILQRARKHFLDKGWTEEEITERIKFKGIEREFMFAEFNDGTMEHECISIRVPVEIKEKV